MAEAIKISLLPNISVLTMGPNDRFIITDMTDGSDPITKQIAVGSFTNWITDQELNFTKHITFTSIGPPGSGEDFNAVIDNLVINDSLTIGPVADVNGLKLNHLEDVNVVFPQNDQFLIYDNGIWTNQARNFVEEAPVDGNIYARQDGRWVDITERLLPIAGDTIGDLTIERATEGHLIPGDSDDFTVFVDGGSPRDAVYEWIVTPSETSTIINSNKATATITFNDEANYVVKATIYSVSSDNSPKFKTIIVPVDIKYRLITDPDGDPLKTQDDFYIMTDNTIIEVNYTMTTNPDGDTLTTENDEILKTNTKELLGVTTTTTTTSTPTPTPTPSPSADLSTPSY